MDSKDIIATTKRLSTEHGCPTALQEYHGEVLGAIKDSVDLLIEKIDQYENISLLNGDNNNELFTIKRKDYVQRMYNGFKKVNKLEKDFTDHKNKTLGKDLTKLGAFTKNVLQPIAWLIFVAFMIYSFFTNRSDFQRSDKLQRTIERTEQSK